MNHQVEVIGGTAKFFRLGRAFTVPGAGTATVAAKPGLADPVWTHFGASEVAIKPKFDEKEIKDIGLTGHRVITDVVRYGSSWGVSIKCKKMQNLLFEMIFGAAEMADSTPEGTATEDIEAGGAFVLGENQEAVKGWLSFQYKGRNGALTDGIWLVSLKPNEDFAPGEEPTEYEVLATVLHTTLNAGNVA